MKLATLRGETKPVVSVVDTDRSLVWPLSELARDLPAECAADLAAAIAWLVAGGVVGTPLSRGQDLAAASFMAPILNPPHGVICVGKNYRDHALEFSASGYDGLVDASDAVPTSPIVFVKPSLSLSGAADDIPLWPGLADALDYEAELAVVIGKGGRAIPRNEAARHIFGYTILNDVTARDLQQRHKQWFLGKGAEGFAPCGPWIVTADELRSDEFRVIGRVNGEVRQSASTAALIFDIPALIETISQSIALRPGDLIATGTPEGVGIGFRPPRFLREGDVVEVEIPGIGCIRNVVRRPGNNGR